MASDDKFLGTWELIPEMSQYELGQPPRSGIYKVSASGSGYAIEVDWTTPEGALAHLAYHAIPDDQVYPQADNAFADATSMTHVGERRLDSSAFKAGRLTLHVSRILSENGLTMHVCQTNHTPDGAELRNRSVYRKR